MVSETDFYGLVNLVVSFLKTVQLVPGFSLYLAIQLLLWATATGAVLWFFLSKDW